jgi:transposase-like protein
MAINIPRTRRSSTHDPALIARLLAERARSGASFSALSARSGIPAATLAWHAHRQRQLESSAEPTFVELVPAVRVDAPRVVELRIRVATEAGEREIVVPPGFDASELLRVIQVLEAAC